jgi:preprotein translocase subunit SecA
VARKIIELHKPYAEAERKVDAAKRAIKTAEGDEDKAKTKEEKEAARKRREEAERQLPIAEENLKNFTQYYEVELDRKSVHLTHEGIAAAQEEAGVGSFYVGNNMEWPHLMEQSLRAHVVYEKDKDYVVDRGRSGEQEIVIVDEYTGRKMTGRQWSDGLHQACEAKERVQIKQETQTLATITLQNFFKLYKALSGMTGTAQTESEEFMKIYRLEVVTIPTNRACIRQDNEDRVYRSEREKWDAIIEEIKEESDKGRPVLVGTTSVEKSELLSGLLLRRGVPHEVLNAKFHEKEAQIVAQAGRKGAVTVATNMAGRGTDIMLGGNPEFTAAAELAARGLSPVETPEDYEAAWPDALEKAKASVAAEHEEVVSLGGLYVLGTERHESRRIDNQLRGRSGRQGDPGESRFYLSLGDDLMRLFNAHMVEAIMDRLNLPEDQPIESKMVTRSIRSAQTQIEQQNFEIRKNVLKYDEVLNKQRTVIYEERRRVLLGDDIHEQIVHMVEDVVHDYVSAATSEGFAEDWDLDTLWTGLKQLYPISITLQDLEERSGGGLNDEFLIAEITQDALEAYVRREEELGSEVLRELERRVILSVLDRKWREHLYEMDYLQEGIGLRGYGQRDPLVEYQREAFDMFGAMMDGIKEESVGFLFNLEVQAEEEEPPPAPEPTMAPSYDAGVAGEPVPSEAPAAFTEAPASFTEEPAPQQPPSPPQTERERVANVLGQVLGQPNRPAGLQYSAPTVDGEGGVQRSQAPVTRPDGSSDTAQFGEVARNAPCPCGSGRKYKRCHGAPSNR